MPSHFRSFAARSLLPVAAVLYLSAGFSTTARAADFSLSGSLVHHNDIVAVDFTLAASASDVRLWTDSWQSGLNFDPTATLWVQSGADFAQLAFNDDDDTLGLGQGYYDSGLLLPTLAAGQYRVTLAASLNAPNGTLLSQGFAYDGQTPVLLADWNQPSYDPNANDQKGGLWRLHLDGVDSVSAVPEPGSWLLAALGLVALGLRRRMAPGPRQDSYPR